MLPYGNDSMECAMQARLQNTELSPVKQVPTDSQQFKPLASMADTNTNTKLVVKLAMFCLRRRQMLN